METRAGLFETLRCEMKLRNYSHKTMKAYQSCVRTFVRYLRPKRRGRERPFFGK